MAVVGTSTKGREKAAIVALGFCTSAAKLFRFPGWRPKSTAFYVRSYAYHTDDGGFFASP